MTKRAKNRDDRDYDTTQLREAGHGQTLGRDYSAHFFRWSFARRLISKDDHVLEVGCGQDLPLSKILFGGVGPRAAHYTGVDLNKLPTRNHQHLTLHGEFNFNARHEELLAIRPKGFDVVVHLEVIEHMKVEHGQAMLAACYKVLKPGGTMLMSTPCYDGVRHAANHIHEFYVDELKGYVEAAGFVVEKRFGTFMDVKHIGQPEKAPYVDSKMINHVKEALAKYYDSDAISCIFAPLYPDHARNNLWVCRRPT
jgi:2-polyprenyl-3-methyl-5-hydroxy-6-metoxy-1,4-benzoquinol methylase